MSFFMALYLNDKTANGNNLTNVGAVEVAGLGGTTIAADLEASSGHYLYASDSASLSLSGNFTLELRVKAESFPSAGNTQWLLVKGSDDGVNNFSYWFGITDAGSGNMLLRLIISANGTYSAGNDKQQAWTAPSTGTDYHLAVTWTASSGTVRYYVDGTQLGSDVTTSSTGALFDSTQRLTIGAERADTTPRNFFDGVIDEIRIWNVVRTQSQINDNKSVRLGGGNSGLVAYWEFETGYVTALADGIGLTEALTAPIFILVMLAEAMALSDTPGHTTAHNRPFSDPLSLTDDLVRQLDYVKEILSGMGLTDDVVGGYLLASALSDSIALSDALSIAKLSPDKNRIRFVDIREIKPKLKGLRTDKPSIYLIT